ncbi:MAG TPA: tyrosine-type recombinase/integrase [Phycisphaerales bacterium]|nr:tyrosine-type recombinase/integrase [Phycisphaerales bacterium]
MSVHRVLRKDGDTSYEVRWREGTRQRSRRFELKRDADAWDREVTRRRQLGPLAVQQLTVKGPTLSDWIVTRWSPEHASNLEQKTRTLYANTYAVHIEPWLGHLKLQELTVGRLREWQADRLRDSVTPNTIMKARTVLSSVLRHAAESEAIAGNPILLVRPPKADHRDQAVALAPSTIEKIRALLPDRDATMISVLAYSGVRPGELRALRWGDVGQTTLLVQRGADPDGKPKATKTVRGVRNVRLLAPLAGDLAAWRAQTGGRGSDLVFPTKRGTPMTEKDWNNWRGRVFRPARRALELPDATKPYDLRHSFASLLLAEGRTVHYVAEQLGHDPTLTLNTYGHLIAEYADRLNINADEEITNARGDQPDRPTLLTADQAAAQLGCPRQRIYDLRAQGRLNAIRIAGRLYLRPQDLDPFTAPGDA